MSHYIVNIQMGDEGIMENKFLSFTWLSCLGLKHPRFLQISVLKEI